MGITREVCQLLFYGKSIGVSFDKTLMLGRLKFYMKVSDVRENIDKYGNNEIPLVESNFNSLYSEPLLEVLGAKQIDSIDISNYEDATILHDLNNPVDTRYHNSFSAIIDGGTLEHIFNFPVAIENCMKCLKTGGHFIGISPANNQLGHGFYQFSPELFYRTFSNENGFKVKFMGVVVPDSTEKIKWYAVADPDKVDSRVMVVNAHPLSMVIIAEKIRDAEIFKETPQQVDYVKKWSRHELMSQNKRAEKESLVRFVARKILPLRVKIVLSNIRDIFTKKKINDPFLGIIDNEHFREVDI